MKALIVAVNAKYSHTSLAVRYLVGYNQAQFPGLQGLEYNINQDPGLILADLARRRPDLVGFSAYIWNIEMLLPLIGNLRKVCPQTTIIMGGPEVSFDRAYWLQTYGAIDYIIAGEGEQALGQFLQAFQEGGKQIPPTRLKALPGLVYRQGGEIRANPPQLLDLASVPPLYEGDLSPLKNKIVYYETTRGCPFRCAYCLSAVMGGVRKFPLERSLVELEKLAKAGVEQVRLVDRTFNYDQRRALQLLRFMIDLDTKTRFQLEVSGDILTGPILQLLKSAPANRFQFEIGVQSTHGPTLKAVSRRSDLERLAAAVRFLKKQTKVRVLLDLIAGLPLEDFWRFGQSFDYVYNLKPDRIHLGFLKLLRGSPLRKDAASFGCVYSQEAPYEVLGTSDLSFQELGRLKTIEDLVDKYGGGRFQRSLEYLLRDGRSPFHFFNDFAQKWEEAGHHWLNHSLMSLYKILADIFQGGNPDLLAWVKYDFRQNEPRRGTPSWLGGLPHRRLENGLIRSGEILKYLPELEGLAPREMGRRIFVEEFPFQNGAQTILFYFAPGEKKARALPLV